MLMFYTVEKFFTKQQKNKKLKINNFEFFLCVFALDKNIYHKMSLGLNNIQKYNNTN